MGVWPQSMRAFAMSQPPELCGFIWDGLVESTAAKVGNETIATKRQPKKAYKMKLIKNLWL